MRPQSPSDPPRGVNMRPASPEAEVGNPASPLRWAILRAILRLPNLPPSVKPCSHSDGLRWIEPAGWAYTKTWTNKDTKIMRTSVKPCSHSDRTQGKIDLRNESGRPMKVKVVGEVSEK